MRSPQPRCKRFNRSQKTGIALIFVAVMIFSGIGVMGFQALSHWSPEHENPGNTGSKIITDTGTGSYESAFTEVVLTDYGDSINTASGSAPESTYDLGQSIPISLSQSNGGSVAGTAELYISGNKVASTGGSTTYHFNPSSTGSYSWYVEEYDASLGSSDSSTNTLTIDSDPSASASATHSNIDQGQSVSLSASASGGTGGYSYSWSSSLSGSFSSTTAQNPTWTASASGTATLTVKVTDSSGYTVQASTTVTVNSDPSISISSSKNPSDVGQSIDFSTSVSGGTGTYSSYSYILYSGTSTSDSQLASGSSSSFSYTFSSSGSYLLKYSVTDSNGYTASTSLTQNVNTDPSVAIASSQNPTDSGKTVEFSSSVSGGTPGYSYSWSVDGNTYTSQDINVSFSSSGSYSVDLTVTDTAGYSVSQSLTETVNSDPTVSASSNVSSADVNYPIEFSSTPSGGTGGYSYSWTLNGQQISASQDFSYSFSSSGSYTLTVTITDSVGVQSSASVTVTINSNPTVSISSSQNPADVGNSVTFSSSESGGTGTDTYVWYINGVQESTASSFSYSFSAAGTYYVNVTVTDSDGHTASYSLKETVNADPSVVIHVVHNPTDVGIWANFSASISGGTGPFSYSWTINGQSFTTAYVNYTFTASGTFPVSLTVTDANGNTATASVNEVVNPDPTVAAEAQYSSVDQGINDTFYADVSGGTSPFNYTWSLGGSILNYSQEFHMNFSAIGTYDINLTISDSLGEISSSSISVKVIQKPSALIEGSNRTDVSTTTYWEGYGSYGTAPYNYYWFINGVNTSAGLYLEYSFPSSGTYNISLLIVDSQGSRAYAYLNVQVEPKPSVKISESISATDVGIPVHFSSSVAGGTPFFNYTWSVSGIGIVG